ncbi:hypothetical protein BH24CHL4_BH24CHL4_18470 [soil metagenome]
MYELKTRETDASVDAYLSGIEPAQKQADCREIASMMSAVTGFPPKMWGSSIVGFGQYPYKYLSGHEGDASLTGFSSRKRNITLYIMAGFTQYQELLNRLGKYKTGKACLYIASLADVDRGVLRELISKSVEHMRQTYSV